MYEGPVRRSGGIATPPPGPPSGLTLKQVTTRSSPLTFHERALTSGPLQPVVLVRPIGTPGSNIRAKTHSYIHSVYTRRVRFPPPSAGGGAVPDGGSAVRRGGAHLEDQEGHLRMEHHFHTRFKTRYGVLVALLHLEGHHEAQLTR